MPVYNGMPYLPGTIASIRNQTYADFELIICDDASTDETADVCRQAAREDNRVRYIRLDENVGVAANFNRCFFEASGQFFMWVPDDDRYLPRFLERCTDVLERCPEFGSCAATTRIVDEDDKELEIYHHHPNISSESLARRARAILAFMPLPPLSMAGLFRRQALLGTGLNRDSYGHDVLLMWEFILRNRIAIVDEVLFEYRRRTKNKKSLAQMQSEFYNAKEIPAHVTTFLIKNTLKIAEQTGLSNSDLRVLKFVLSTWPATPGGRDLIAFDLWQTFQAARADGLLIKQLLAGAGIAALRPTKAPARLREARQRV
jgi:glycosyltransferase involved in cell wall biosynthesis